MTKNRLHCLTLYLDAPLQSWGYQSRFELRTSYSLPTRSGITGMICAAMGIDRENETALGRFGKLKMIILMFQSSGRLTDFHTVGGGWKKNATITKREYLQANKFGVLITGELNFLQEIENALRNPQWGIWLGRKSCIPATPVCQGIFPDAEAATTHLTELAGVPVQRTIEEANSFEEGSDTLNDIPVNYAKRQYAPRRIRL